MGLGMLGPFDDQELLWPPAGPVIFINHFSWDKGILAAMDKEHGPGILLQLGKA